MTLVTLPSPSFFPLVGNITNAVSLGTAATLTSAGHYIAYTFVAKEAMTVSHVGFRAGTASGSPTIEVRIETLDPATGLPSGTLWNSPTNTTNGTTGTISSNTYVLQALTASASIARGQVFSVKFALASGTSQVISSISNLSNSFASNAAQVINTGTPTKSALANTSAAIALGSSSTTFYQVPGTIPCSGNSGGTFNNTNSARRGLRFTPPMNCRAVGVRWFNGNQTGDFNAVLYDDAGSELGTSSTSFDGDYSGASNNGANIVYFDNSVSLTAGITYRVAIEPTSATNVNVPTITLPSTSYQSGSPLGTMGHYTTYASGSWDDGATNQANVPLMDLIYDQVDNGSGTGGGGVIGVIGG